MNTTPIDIVAEGSNKQTSTLSENDAETFKAEEVNFWRKESSGFFGTDFVLIAHVHKTYTSIQ